MPDSVYNVIELVGTNTDSCGRRLPKRRWKWPPNL